MLELGSPKFWEQLEEDPKKLAAEVCSINLVDLDTTLQRHPAMRAWLNAAHENARVDEEKAKWEVDQAKAQALDVARQTVDPHTGKAKTVQVLDMEVTLNAMVKVKTLELFEAERKRGALRAMSNALEDRLQMLIQIAAKRRQEVRDSERS